MRRRHRTSLFPFPELSPGQAAKAFAFYDALGAVRLGRARGTVSMAVQEFKGRLQSRLSPDEFSAVVGALETLGVIPREGAAR